MEPYVRSNPTLTISSSFVLASIAREMTRGAKQTTFKTLNIAYYFLWFNGDGYDFKITNKLASLQLDYAELSGKRR